MKSVSLLVSALCFIVGTNAQIGPFQTSDFEDGTTQGWSNGAQSPNPPINIPTGGPNGVGDNFLEEISTGGSGAGSKLVIQNDNPEWSGDYQGQGIALLNADVKNGGSEDLFLRIAMEGGPDNTRMYTNEVISLPGSQTDWTLIGFQIDIPTFWTVESGSSTVEQVLQDVAQIRIISSENGSYNGDAVNGVLHIDNITAEAILGTNGNVLNDVTVYPNPVSDVLNVASSTSIENFEIFNIAGQKITEGELDGKFLQVSNLSEGLYFLRLSNILGARTIKFVKR